MIKAVIFDINGVVDTGESNQDVLDIIRRLREKGYIVVALSNFSSTYAGSNAKHGDIFSQTFLGNELGMLKPNPEIYRHVLDTLKIEPKEAVFIDDLPENVQGAEAVGIHGILFENAGQLRQKLLHIGLDM